MAIIVLHEMSQIMKRKRIEIFHSNANKNFIDSFHVYVKKKN